MMISVTKRFEFCYGHSLPEHKGKCKNQHGHNAMLEVEFGSVLKSHMKIIPKIEEHSMDGMLIDFGIIKKVIEYDIIKVLDHQHMNEIFKGTKYFPPTAENMCRWIWDEIIFHFPNNLLRVRLYETPDSYAEIKK